MNDPKNGKSPETVGGNYLTAPVIMIGKIGRLTSGNWRILQK
jgi:hypothetical protein